MKQIVQKTYEGNNLFFPNASIIGLFALNAGTLKTVRVKVNAPSASGATRFNLKKNSVAIFDDELEIASGQSSISITDLDIEISRFDVLVLSLETVPEGGVLSPIALQIETEEVVLASKADIYNAVKETVLQGSNITITEDDEEQTLTISGLSGGAEYLDDLEDVVIAGETEGDFLVFVDGEWINVTPSEVKEFLSLNNVTNDAQLKRAGNDWSGFTEKTTLHNDDLILIEDSEASGAKKKVKKSNIGSGDGGSWDGGMPSNATKSKWFFSDEMYNPFIAGQTDQIWTMSGNSVGNRGTDAGIAGHPGIYWHRVDSGTTNQGSHFLMYPGNPAFLHSSDYFEINWVIKPNHKDSIVVYRIGLMIGGGWSGTSSGNGFFFEKKAANNYFEGVCKNSSETVTSAFADYTANTWYLFTIKRDASGVHFSINNGTPKTVSTGLVSAALVPGCSVNNVASSAAQYRMDIDYFDLAINNLTRF